MLVLCVIVVYVFYTRQGLRPISELDAAVNAIGCGFDSQVQEKEILTYSHFISRFIPSGVVRQNGALNATVRNRRKVRNESVIHIHAGYSVKLKKAASSLIKQ